MDTYANLKGISALILLIHLFLNCYFWSKEKENVKYKKIRIVETIIALFFWIVLLILSFIYE